jgi:hypothetical protein
MTADIEQGPPNLDAMDISDLSSFWQKTTGPNRHVLATRCFPDQKNCRLAFKRLGQYASAKIDAMKARLNGDIEEAMMRERICDSIYNQLPEWARW